MWKNYCGRLITALILVLLFGCAHPMRPMDVKEDWTSQGSGAFHSMSGPLLQGVAFARGIKNPTLLKTAAANRAKAQLKGLLNQYVSALIQYTGQDMATVQTRQLFREIVRLSIDQARITDHWYDQANNKSYARCVLTLDTFKQTLMAVSAPQTVKTDMETNAELIFEAFVSAPRTRP